MKKQLKVLSFLALGLSLTVRGQAQQSESVSALEEVVLYGLKTPQKEALIGKNVTVLKESDLKAYSGYSVSQLINTVSGITIQGSGLPMGNTQSIYARGGRSKQVLILIDGIRLADPYSASLSYDLRLLDLSNIKQIEVLKGASSAVYGTSASTVVIAITTKENQDGSLVINSGIGTNQTADDQNMSLNYKSYGLSHHGILSKLNYRLNYSHVFEGGVSALEQTIEADPFKRSSFSLLLNNDASNRLSWKLMSSYSSMTADYDDSYMAVDEPFQFITDRLALGFQSTYKLPSGSLFLGMNHNQFDSEAISNYSGAFKSVSSNLDLYYKGSIGKTIEGLFGIQASIDASESINESSVSTIDPYASVFLKTEAGFNLNTALRLNHHQTYGNHFVGHINPSFSFGKENQHTLYSSVASAFISPSLFQLYGDWGANKDLTPEENTTYEFGLRSKLGSTSWNILAFKRNETNAVFWNSEIYQYDNSVGTTDAKGVEFDLNTRFTKELQLKFNYTFIQRDQSLMIRIPKHKVNLATTYVIGKSRFLLEVQYLGKRYDTDFSTYTDIELVSYTLLNLNWNYRVNQQLNLQLGIRNLFNKDFVEQIGYNSLGRNLRLSLNYNLF